MFLHVIRAHGVKIEEIDSLTYKDIKILRSTNEFILFKELYYKMCSTLQSIDIAGAILSKDKIRKFKSDLFQNIESRYHAEQRHLNKCYQVEDFGGALILGGLGFALAGPGGAAVGAALGLLQPTLRTFKASPVDLIIKKLKRKNFGYYLYLELLQENIRKFYKRY